MNDEFFTQLAEAGYATAASQSAADVRSIIGRLGEVIYVTDVKVNPNSRALVTSARGLDFHTDHHKAKWILWHCFEQTDVGGESVLVDGAAAYGKLSPQDRDDLSRVRLLEHKVFDDDEDSHPVVTGENGALKLYYSFWLADKNMPEAQKKAFRAFRGMVDKEKVVVIKLQQGDVLAVNNHRIFHGRREIQGHQKRFLKRFWIK